MCFKLVCYTALKSINSSFKTPLFKKTKLYRIGVRISFHDLRDSAFIKMYKMFRLYLATGFEVISSKWGLKNVQTFKNVVEKRSVSAFPLLKGLLQRINYPVLRNVQTQLMFPLYRLEIAPLSRKPWRLPLINMNWNEKLQTKDTGFNAPFSGFSDGHCYAHNDFI